MVQSLPRSTVFCREKIFVRLKKNKKNCKAKPSKSRRRMVETGGVSEKASIALNKNHSARSAKLVSQKQKSQRQQRKNIHAVSGIRTLATLWIVLGHFQATAFAEFDDTNFLLVLNRGFIPVGIYIVLSGFITHYAYRKKSYDSMRMVSSFYLRRVGRVAFTYWASCILGMIDPLLTRHEGAVTEFPGQAAATFFMVQSWLDWPSNPDWHRDIFNNPNPGGWTISTLLFAWILYPLLNKVLMKWNKYTNSCLKAKVYLMLGVWAVAMLPCFVMYYSQDFTITNQQFEFLYKFPPFRLCDFIVGMLFAELAGEKAIINSCVIRYLPDAVTIAFIGFVSFVELAPVDLSSVSQGVEQPLLRENEESFLISGLTPILGFLLMGFSINSGREDLPKVAITRILQHPILIGVGAFSFAVYCFQYTLYFMFEQWQFSSTGIQAVVDIPELGDALDTPAKLIATYLLPYLLVLWTFAALWTVYLEAVFAARLSNFCKTKLERPRQPTLDTSNPSQYVGDADKQGGSPRVSMETLKAFRSHGLQFLKHPSDRESVVSSNRDQSSGSGRGNSSRKFVTMALDSNQSLDTDIEQVSVSNTLQSSFASTCDGDDEFDDSDIESSGETEQDNEEILNNDLYPYTAVIVA